MRPLRAKKVVNEVLIMAVLLFGLVFGIGSV
jgi:hypothetical protein